MERDKISVVLAKFVRRFNIQLSSLSIENELLKHPAYPSLLAISEVLNNWKIPNAAYGVSFEQLPDVPCPYIAHFNDGQFVVVKALNKNRAVLSGSHRNHYKLGLEDFKRLYTGSVLAVEAEEEGTGINDKLSLRKELANRLRIPFVWVALLFVLGGLLFTSPYHYTLNLAAIWLIICKSAGLIVAVMLLIQSIDSNNPIIQKICSNGKKNDCNAILSSKAAKITNELSWSEVGFFYFAGTWLSILFNSNDLNIIHILAILNLLSIPYTFYSIYYQWQVAKQWCVFCISIQVLIWLEFIGFYPYLLKLTATPTYNGWVNLMICLILPVTLWIFIKPFLLQAKQVFPLKQQLQRFKYNAGSFFKELNDNPKFALPDHEYSIILGNPDAERIITMVTNPLCQPCSKAHKVLDEWLESRDDIKLQLIFADSTVDTERAMINSHFMAVKSQYEVAYLKQALNEWYDRVITDYHSLAGKFPVTTDPGVEEIMDVQRQWCETAQIKGTPTIFINGRQLPDLYRAEDIKYFI